MDKIPPNRRAENTSRGTSKSTSRGTIKGTSRGTTDSMKRCTSASTPDPRAPALLSLLALWTVRRWWAPPRSLWTWDTSYRWVYQGQFSQVGVSGAFLTVGCIRDRSHRWVYQGHFSQLGVLGTGLTGGCIRDNSHRWVYQGQKRFSLGGV
jgi:hypothetical protein